MLFSLNPFASVKLSEPECFTHLVDSQEFLTRGKGNFKWGGYQGRGRDRTNSVQELQVIQNSTETKKTESFRKCLLPSPASESLPAYKDHRARLVSMSARSRVAAVEPQGLHWYLGACAGHLGSGEGSHSVGAPLPITRGSEWSGGISTGGAAAAFWVKKGKGRA